MSRAYCAMAAAHVWLGQTCAVANCQQQQRQHGANAGCADGSNMILYLAFSLDDTVGEWPQVRDLFLCNKTLHVMILDCLACKAGRGWDCICQRWSQGPWDPPHGKADATSEPGHLWWNACPEQPGWTLPWWLWEDEGLGRALQEPFERWVLMGWGCTSWCSSSWRSSSTYHWWDGH